MEANQQSETPEQAAARMEKERKDETERLGNDKLVKDVSDIKATLARLEKKPELVTGIKKFSSERDRSDFETMALQLESAELGEVRSSRKVRTVHAHAQGVISEQFDAEGAITERLSLFQVKLDRFDQTVNDRRKREHPTAARLERAAIVLALIAFASLLVVEIARPGVLGPAAQGFGAFVSNPYKAAWLLALVVSVGVPVTVFVWKRKATKPR